MDNWLLILYLVCTLVFACTIALEIAYSWTLTFLAWRSRHHEHDDDVESRNEDSRSSVRGEHGQQHFLVFVVPALDGALVIEHSIRSLRAAGGIQSAVLVVDDDSHDATASIVESLVDDRTWLYRRTAPESHTGKGAALNDAYRPLHDGDLLDGSDPNDIIICVMDTDAGAIEQQAVLTVGTLVRQRQRWFHGTLQCSRHVGPIMRNSRLRKTQRTDLIHSILGPLLIIQSALIVSVSITGAAFVSARFLTLGLPQLNLTSTLILGFGVPYLLAFHFVPGFPHEMRKHRATECCRKEAPDRYKRLRVELVCDECCC